MTITTDIDSATERAARTFIAKVAARYNYAGAILFGSRTRHTNRTDSNTDIAVILHGHLGKFVSTKLEMVDIAYDTLLETGIRIQPLPIWEEEWAHPEAYSNPLLLRNIEREGCAFECSRPDDKSGSRRGIGKDSAGYRRQGRCL